jgi:hypothetical protein
MIENRGALPEITDHGVEKREQKEFLSKRLCFLTCLLMGDPNSPVVVPSRKKPAEPSAQQSVILDCSYIKESFKKFQSFQPF